MNISEIKRQNKRKIQRIKEIKRQKGILGVTKSIYRYIKSNCSLKNCRSIKNYYINWLKYRKTNSLPNPYKIIYINPKKIKYMVIPRFQEYYSKKYSYILPGSWDVNKTNAPPQQIKETTSKNNRKLALFNKYFLYQSFKEHYINEEPWNVTEFYTHGLEKVENSPNSSSRYGSREKFLNRLDMLDRLFVEIKENGYKTQKELHGNKNTGKRYPLNDSFRIIPEKQEILVDIGRNGEFIFDDGRHRVSMVKLLSLDEVPVRIFVRHTKWQEIRREVAEAESIDELSEKALTHLNHPDMNDVKKGLLV